MADATCTEPDCERLAYSRGLCKSDYGRRYRNGTLPDWKPAANRHELTDLNHDLSTATCSSCGPGARFRRRTGRGARVECRGKRLSPRKAYPNSAAERRRDLLRRNYKMSPEEYADLLAKQDGCCRVCLKQAVENEVLAVDHDHACCSGDRSCGQCVRGLLCRRCNLGLGYFGDDIEVLGRAIRYLAAVT